MLPTPVTGCMVASCFRVLFIVTGYACKHKVFAAFETVVECRCTLAVDCVMVLLVLDCSSFALGFV